MCDKPASGYNYGERNVYRNGEAVVYVHFTLDWQYREGRSLDESWGQAEHAARAVATLGPDMMICEPTSGIGTGSISSDDYIRSTNEALKRARRDWDKRKD